MMKGFQILKPTIDFRAPITLDMLKSFPTALLNIAFSKYEALLFSIAFSGAFFVVLHIGEIVAMIRRGDTSKILSVSDVKVGPKNIEINLRYSKTDQLAKSARSEFYPCEAKQVCPVSLLTTKHPRPAFLSL